MQRHGVVRTTASFVLMAGGMGRRFGGDKQVEPVGPNGEPLGAYTAYDALQAGFDEVVLVARPGAEALVLDTFRRALGERAPLRVVPQRLDGPTAGRPPPDRPRPWGTAHAALAAAQHIDGAFGIANADDAYGRDALIALHRALTRAAPGAVALISYRASDVLSTEGGVSRGWIRQSPDGGIDVTEIHQLKSSDSMGFLEGTTEAGEAVRMPSDAPVSMNLWGVSVEAVQALRAGWEHFIAGLSETEDRHLNAEYGLSTALTALAREGQVDLCPEPGGTQWFGMTFAADRPLVGARLAALHADGTYPVSLVDGEPPRPRPHAEYDL